MLYREKGKRSYLVIEGKNHPNCRQYLNLIKIKGQKKQSQTKKRKGSLSQVKV
jgi:hypothetical protein